MDDLDPGNLLAGAYIACQWHLELVRISGNRAALAVYCRAIPPAVWIAGANYFQIEEAASQIRRAGESRVESYPVPAP